MTAVAVSPGRFARQRQEVDEFGRCGPYISYAALPKNIRIWIVIRRWYNARERIDGVASVRG
jgi:hypothetical protein